MITTLLQACGARHIFPISEIIVEGLSGYDAGLKYALTTSGKLENIKVESYRIRRTIFKTKQS
jgi:hypothetical protein